MIGRLVVRVHPGEQQIPAWPSWVGRGFLYSGLNPRHGDAADERPGVERDPPRLHNAALGVADACPGYADQFC